jgi:hypothetical protein
MTEKISTERGRLCQFGQDHLLRVSKSGTGNSNQTGEQLRDIDLPQLTQLFAT